MLFAQHPNQLPDNTRLPAQSVRVYGVVGAKLCLYLPEFVQELVGWYRQAVNAPETVPQPAALLPPGPSSEPQLLFGRLSLVTSRDSIATPPPRGVVPDPRDTVGSHLVIL